MKLFTQSCLLLASFVLLFSSCTVQDHLQPLTSNCLLVKVSEQYQVMDGSNLEEILEIEGQKIPIKTTSSLFYKYDQQGRMIEQYDDQHKFTSLYEYLPNAVKWTSIPDPDLPYSMSATNIFNLDSQGFFSSALSKFDSEGYQIYYSDAYLWHLYKTITDGNVTKAVRTESGTEQTYEYEYDLTQPNKIPSPNPIFNGKGNRNLLIKEKFNIGKSSGTGYSSITDYKYIYDQNGNVKNRVGFRKLYNSANELTSTDVVITGYKITCP
ncbi:hypothetical protein [Larkinella sp.]|uniref:hypothetical protein n=1 Tax=Larkinella sp. TaxID=2034517 RepID=UPI003BAB5945